MEKDFYEILGIPKDAKIDLIKSVYRSLGQIYHPDKYNGDKKYAEEKMKEINEAYSILSSVKKRDEYDKKFNFQPKSFKEREFEQNKTRDSKETPQSNRKEKQRTKQSLIEIIFGPNFFTDMVKVFFLGIGFMLIFALGTFVYVYTEHNLEFIIDRVSDRILFSSVFGFLLGLFLYATDFKVNKFLCLSKILGTTLLTIFLILLIPEQEDKIKSGFKNDCKWTNAGRYSEPDC